MLFIYYWNVWQNKVLLTENTGKLSKEKGESSFWWGETLASKERSILVKSWKDGFMYVISNGSVNLRCIENRVVTKQRDDLFSTKENQPFRILH